ncbi:hypothetical protein B0H17DRAFT_1180301 [Mycena rosella]|uniref:Uncharacterized protein n=1 Tax=Mycena rosella TaxID=1033263 RepID=A0AAD7GG06_MYCRO|nr:hypothetical protein B0H17DRAFT_1180301 [Mycena rosella]
MWCKDHGMTVTISNLDLSLHIGRIAPMPHAFPELRKVTFDGEKQISTLKVFNHMNIPSLKDLFLVDCRVWDTVSLSSLLQRSACQLEQLVLQTTDATHTTGVCTGELLILLRLTPTLTTLVLTQLLPNAITDALLEALIAQDATPAVLPVLTALVLAGIYLFSTDQLLNMLESRTTPHNHHGLRTVDITLPSRQVSIPHLQRFSAVMRAVESSSLACLDEARSQVRIQVGKYTPLDWCHNRPVGRGSDSL